MCVRVCVRVCVWGCACVCVCMNVRAAKERGAHPPTTHPSFLTMPMALRRRFRSMRSSSSRNRILSARAFSGSIVVSNRLMAALCVFDNQHTRKMAVFGFGGEMR